MVVSPNIIWIDGNEESLENKIYINQLISLGYYKIETFSDINKAIKKIKTIEFEETIIIVSGSLYNQFIEEFKLNLNGIYVIPKIIIFLGNKEKYLENCQYMGNFNYINHPFYNSGGVHNNFEEIKNFIMNQNENNKVMLKRDDDDEKNLIFESIDCEEKLALPMFYKSLIKITPEDKADLFTQKLYDKYSPKCQALKDLLDPIMSLKNIPPQLLCKYYSRIYTSECGFYNDLNNDLREKRRDEYMPFIKVLYEGLKYKSLLLASNEELYRGGKISKEQFEIIKNSKITKKEGLPPGIVFSKTFLSFTKDRKIAEKFLFRNDTPQDNTSDNLLRVLFILKNDKNLDYTLSTHADIEKISFYQPEREVLFFPFSSFAIENYQENVLCGNTKYNIIYLFYLGKYVDKFQKEIQPQISLTDNIPGMVQSQITPAAISPGMIQSQFTPIPNNQGIIQSQIVPTANVPGMIQSQIPLTPTESFNLPSAPNILKKVPDSKFKNELMDSGLVPKEKIKLIKVGSLVNEFQKHKEEIKKVKTLPPIEEEKKTVINIYPKAYVTRIYEEEKPEPPIIEQSNNYITQEIRPINLDKNINYITQGIPPINLDKKNKDITQGISPKILNQKNKDITQGIPPIILYQKNKDITQGIPPINIDRNNNYINAEINIDKNNVNKLIRIINSYEEYKRLHLYLKVYDESKYENEKDIKDCQIKIDGNQFNFGYYHIFSTPGKHKIQYSFPSFLTKTDFMFADCEYLENIDFQNFNTKYIYNMSFMFYRCTSLKYINLINFFTNRVTDMSSMFNGCESLDNLDLSYFNTKNVNNMSRMFFCCKSLQKLNVSNFNTEEVFNMYSMFSGCIALEDLNLSSFNTRNVKNMSRMFSGCCSLKYLNISNFNTLNVLYMSNLFSGNTSLQKLNMSNFNTQNVVNMDDMFEGCTSLFPQNIICNAPVIRKVNYYR